MCEYIGCLGLLGVLEFAFCFFFGLASSQMSDVFVVLPFWGLGFGFGRFAELGHILNPKC